MSDVTTWRYSLPSIKHEGWGIFLLDSSGVFTVVSDYGNYGYRWTSFGGCFRSFLCQLETDSSYLGRKLTGGAMVYDEERTRAVVRGHILEARRDRSMAAEEAADEWHILSELESFEAWHCQTEIDNAYELYCSKVPGDVVAFCERLYPRLVKVLRAELDNERGPR